MRLGEIGRDASILWPAIHPLYHATELAADATELVGHATELGGHATELGGGVTDELADGATDELHAPGRFGARLMKIVR